ncbi:MAG: FeoA family protein, partial [Nanoarchaeota archaeon]|nr:FeoA family protein [Nanoarchaeota archaeon]
EGRLQVQSQEKQKHIVPLPLLKKNQKGTISHICGDSIIVQRLSDLGLTPMSKIMLVRKMMHNGPIEITVRRTTLAIDRNIANNIFINLDL